MKKRITYKIFRNSIREERLEWFPIEKTETGVKIRFIRHSCPRYTQQQIQKANVKIAKYFRGGQIY